MAGDALLGKDFIKKTLHRGKEFINIVRQNENKNAPPIRREQYICIFIIFLSILDNYLQYLHY